MCLRIFGLEVALKIESLLTNCCLCSRILRCRCL